MTHYYRLMTRQQRRQVRLQLAKEQGNMCWYCKQPLSGPPSPDIDNYAFNKHLFPKGMFDFPVHLHHDHNSGICVGAVHAKCNAYMWQKYRK